MAHDASARPTLRLVSAPDDQRVHVSREGNTPPPAARRRVESENQSAARLDPHDARWAFAVRVSHLLEGSTSGTLAPDRRKRLVTQARGLGLREFDANLVIAIIQDNVRAGRPPLDPEAESRLSLIRPPQQQAEHPSDRRTRVALALVATLVAAATLCAVLINWVLG